MLKARGKIILTLMLALIVGVLFAVTAFAVEGADIRIQFYDSNGNNVDGSITTNGIVKGVIDIKGGQSVKLPTKNVAAGKSYNWRSDDGRAWEGGTTVVFYESTKLYPVEAYDISTAEEMYTHMPNGAKVRLLNDIYLDKKPNFPWPGSCTVLMNGKTLEINSSLGDAWGGQRAGTYFYGTGTIKYAGSGTFMNLQGHGWGGDNCRLFVGAGITLDAPNATLGRDGDGSYVQGYPWIQIFGIVNCKTVLNMQNAGNRNPRIEVYDGAQLKVSDVLIKHSTPGNTVRVNILGGNIKTTGSTSFFADGSAVFTITGGSFEFASSGDYAILNETIAATADTRLITIDLKSSDGKTYKTVISTATCAHEYELNTTYQASCQSCAKDAFVCKNCETVIHIAYGAKGDHSYSETPIAHLDPTKTTVGWDKYMCSGCSSIKLSYIYYDPRNDKVVVIVNTGSGEKSVEAVVKDVFIVDSNYTITGVKAFGDYSLTDIVGITIPVGIANVNITTNNTNASVKQITFATGMVGTVTSLKGLTSLETIVIENVADLEFKRECAPKTVKSIKSDISGANVEYAEGAFLGYTNLTEMTFSSGSTYVFGKQSFKESGVKSLNFVDNCKVDFKGEQAFYASKLEYLYVGKGITTLANKPFDCTYYLQTIILMDVTKLSTDYTFCCMNKGANAPVVYHHASSLELGGNTFYQSHGITIYTTAPITQGFNSCNSYTIHYGITHAYDRVEKEPTCTEEGSVTYITTCPCGENEGTSHKVFKNNVTSSSNYTIEDYTNKIKEKLPHDFSTVGNIAYVNGYTRQGYYAYKCDMCKGVIPEDAPSCPPLITAIGYSVYGKTSSMSVKYIVNSDALAMYEKALGKKIQYGSVVAIKELLNGNTPLDENGNARSGVIKVNTSNQGYTSNSIKLTNIQDASKNVSYVMSLYIIADGEITYIQDTENVKNPSGVTYREVNELNEYYESIQVVALPVTSDDE